MADGKDLDGAIQEFLFQMGANGRSPSSVISYARELDLLQRSLCNRAVATITSHHLSLFLASPPARLRRDGGEKAVTTLNRTKSVIRGFFAWCKTTARVEGNPAFLVRSTTACTPPVKYMSRREVRRFLSSIERSVHPLARRDHALFSTLAYTGVRLSEITRAAWGDLDVRRRLLLLCFLKGGRAETRHVSRRLLQILVDYRRGVGNGRPADLSPMFVSCGDRPLSPRGVQYRFAFWLTRSAIRRRMSVPALRHTFGSLLHRLTGDLLLVSRALGHRDVRTTQRYAHVEDRLLVSAVNRL